MRKMTEEDYKRLGKQAGFEWMGPSYPKTCSSGPSGVACAPATSS